MRAHQAWLEAAETFSLQLLTSEIDHPLDRLALTAGELADADRVTLFPPAGRGAAGQAPRAWDRSGRAVPVTATIAGAVSSEVDGSTITLPLARSDGPTGTLVLDRDTDRQPFTPADLDDAQLFVTRGSAAIELMERRAERHRYLEFFQTMVSQVVEYAIVGLDDRGKVASWNAGAERLWGYTRDQVIGQDYSTFHAVEDLEAGVSGQLLETARENGRAHYQGWVPRANGARFWAESSISALRDERGTHIGFAVLTRDMTEAMKLEQARESFFASVSHDIRAPLTAILGFTEMLSIAGRDDQEEFVQRVRNNVVALGVMVDNMLDHARLQAGAVELSLEPHALEDLVDEFVRDLAPVLTEHKVAVLGSGAVVQVDRLAFGRVMANLLVNAARYSPPGTPIEICVDADDRVGRLVVTDRGRGIDPADLETIFDEFARGSRAEADGGSGLGLSSVYQLVTLQNGTVGIVSDPGVGTAVTIELPLAY